MKVAINNRIDQLFDAKKQNIFSVFFTAGFPSIDSTMEILKTLQNNGIDQVEIGIPFSDPMADGPVIQSASTQALHNGMTLRKLFLQLQDARPQITMPLILMGYLNPIMQYGFENFCQSCAQTGIDGMIIPDLPFDDYVQNYKPIADRYHLRMIMLITPETSDERIHLIDKHTQGFIYMVSSAATTGAQQQFSDEKTAYFRRIAAMNLKNPRLIGFGISNRATLNNAYQWASGAIVGSRFVDLLSQKKNSEIATIALLEDLGLRN